MLYSYLENHPDRSLEVTLLLGSNCTTTCNHVEQAQQSDAVIGFVSSVAFLERLQSRQLVVGHYPYRTISNSLISCQVLRCKMVMTDSTIAPTLKTANALKQNVVWLLNTRKDAAKRTASNVFCLRRTIERRHRRGGKRNTVFEEIRPGSDRPQNRRLR